MFLVGGQDGDTCFADVLQRWLHYAFVPPYKVQSHM